MEVVYFGRTTDGERKVEAGHFAESDRYPHGSIHHKFVDEDLPLYLDQVNHSPDGFEWGYHGSGPSQLAFALLFHRTGNKKVSLQYYQAFKREIIANIKEDTWELPAYRIDLWLAERLYSPVAREY